MIELFGTPIQRQIAYSPARFMTVIGPRRGGKSVAIKNRIVRNLSQPGFAMFYIAPYFSASSELYEQLLGNDTFFKFVARHKVNPFPKIWMRNGAWIGFRAFNDNPEGIRSAGLNEVWFDEIQNCCSEDLFWAVLRPVTIDRGPNGQRGKIGIAGQFRGLNWYYEQFFLRGLTPEQLLAQGLDPKKSKTPDYQSWRLTPDDCISYQGESGKKELQNLEETLPPAVFKQEILCIPSANQNAVFEHEKIESCIIRKTLSQPDTGLLNYATSGRFVIGCDLGWIANQEAIVVLSEAGRVVYTEKFPLGTKHEIAAQKVQMLSKKFNSALVVADFTGGAGARKGGKDFSEYTAIYEKIVSNLKPFYFHQRKEAVINGLAIAFERGPLHLSIPEQHNQLLTELRRYEYTYRKGIYTYGGNPDDLVSALAMAEYGRACGWMGGGVGLSPRAIG